MTGETVLTSADGLRVLVVDDEPPARAELAFLLGGDPRVSRITEAATASAALRLLGEGDVDAVFSDIRMPGLDGIELARVISRFVTPPRIVFVTAYDDRAVDAFELGAVDYLVKPVRAERLAEAVRRAADATGEPIDTGDELMAVELAGVTRFVRRSQIRWVEAQGDYVRLHTAEGSHLIRVTLADLERRWSEAGFARVHRSTLVALAYVTEVRVIDGHCTVRVGDQELQVARRHTRELRDRLAHR